MLSLDEKGRLTTETLPGMAPITYEYFTSGPHAGRFKSRTQAARTWSVTYDTLGRLATMTNPLDETTTLTYDDADRPNALIFPGTAGTVEFGYDPVGRLTRLGTPELQDHVFQYDTRGLESHYTPPGQPATTREWDRDKRFAKVDEPGPAFRQAVYDPGTGELKQVNFERGALDLRWDPETGQLDEVASPGGVVTRYQTDGPLLEAVEWKHNGPSVGSVAYEYEYGRFRPETVTVTVGQSSQTIDYRYDDDGLIEFAGQMMIVRDEQTGRAKSHQLGTAGVRFGYEPIYGELNRIETDNSVEEPTFSINYTGRDALGRITQVVETRRYPLVGDENDVDAYETVTTDYGYDSRGRLETVNTEKVTDEGAEPASDTVYSYDKNGNRTQVVTVVDNVTTTQIARYAADDRLLCMSDGSTLTRFEYTGDGSLETKVVMTTTDSCDTIPAPQCAGNCETTTYDYDSMGNLLGVVLPNGTNITYEVDAAGRRIAKSVNDVLVKRWLWDGQLRPIAELEPNGSISSLFVYGDGVNSPDYMVRRDGPDLVEYTFLKDHLGSVRMVLDARNGTAVQQVSYDAWGVPVAGDHGYQPFGFAGGLYDADTGLVRFGARDYDASTGRWTTQDPIRQVGGLNLYQYSEGDPPNKFDPAGLTVSCRYVQKTGRLQCKSDSSGETVVDTQGYAGKGDGKNNPEMQCVQSVGPIPVGKWKIDGTLYTSPNTGPKTLKLEPEAGTNTCGRSLFRIHGQSTANWGNASQGCIIVGPAHRQAISDEGGGTLEVVQE